MPNGGMLPCCILCKWAERSTEKSSPSSPIECHKHHFSVGLPLSHFCSELSDSAGNLHAFILRENISSGQVYAWIEIHYRRQEYPTIPNYHQEFIPLAPLSVYGAWSEMEKKAEYEKLKDKKWKEFEQKSSST